MTELLEQIQTLDRRELVALIREAAARLEALESEDEWELSPAQKAQIDEVVKAYKRDGNPGEPWEVVRARIIEQSQNAVEWDEDEPKLSPEDERELQRRVADANANPLEGDHWPTVRARITAQLS